MNGRLATLTVDGIEVTVPAGTNVVDAARQAGVEIPVFCHHPCLEPVGACRMCLVEIGWPVVDSATRRVLLDETGRPAVRFGGKLEAACTTTVRDGMVVRCSTPAVEKHRRATLEFLLTSHPLDCPVCDKAGECPLQNLTMRYGPGTSRFTWSDKFRFAKPVPLGPLVILDRERCVFCSRCIRFQEELASDPVLAFQNRGRGMEVVSVSDPPFRSVLSGNTVDLCPVGALTSVDFRHRARVWDLVPRPGVCPHCAVGCNLMWEPRLGRIQRVMPRRNDDVNALWLCDKGRFGHHFASAEQRLAAPLVRRGGELVEATWDEALTYVALRLVELRATLGATAVGGIVGDGLPNEDLYLFGRFLRSVVGSNNVDHLPGIVRDDVLLRAGVSKGTTWADVGARWAVLVVGLDTENEAPVLDIHLRRARDRGAAIVNVSGRPSKLDRLADANLRYRYGSEEELLHAFAAAVSSARSARSGPSRSVPASPAAVGPEPRGGHEGTRSAADVMAAAALALGGSDHLLVLFGLEAARAGLVPWLADLAVEANTAVGARGGLLAVGPHANSRGAADMGLLPDRLPGLRPVGDARARARLHEVWPGPISLRPGLAAGEMLAGGVRALLLAGVDPVADGLADAGELAALDLLVVSELFLTDTARVAHVVLPALSPAEREGTFTNYMGQCQRFVAAADPVDGARADWLVLRDLANRLGVAEPYGGVQDVFAEIASVVPAYRGWRYAEVDGAGRPGRDGDAGFAPRSLAREVETFGTAYECAFGTGLAADADDGHLADSPAGLHFPAAETESDPLVPERDSGPAAGPPASAGFGARTPPATTDRLGPPDGSLTLVVAACLFDDGAMIRPSAVLHPLVPLPRLDIGPEEAEARGLCDGDRVTVTGPGGSATVRVCLTPGISPGCAIARRGWPWSPPLGVLLAGRSTAAVLVERCGS